MAMATTVPVNTVLPRKTLVLIGGNPGIGNTETAKALAKSTALPLLDRGTLLAPFIEYFDVTSTADVTSSVRSLNVAAYSSLLGLAEQVTVYGAGCIVAAPFAQYFVNNAGSDDDGFNAELAEVRKNGVKNNYKVLTVWLSLSDTETHWARMRKRNWVLDQDKLADFHGWLNTQPTAEDVSKNADVSVDIVSKTPDEVAKLIAAHLR